MKTRLTQMLQRINGTSHHRAPEQQVKKIQPTTINQQTTDKVIREKDREIDRLRHALANAEARLQELMGKDLLTGLPNRHIFKENLTNSLKRALRLGYSLSLMLVDIDGMRDINLRYGHEVGDKVLIEVSNILRTSVREIDMPARWGGEELVAVLHETDAEGARAVAERVRRRVEALELRDPRSGKLIRVTATLAVTSYPKHSSEPQSLLEAATEALITAKDAGGNVVIIAD